MAGENVNGCGAIKKILWGCGWKGVGWMERDAVGATQARRDEEF